MSGWAPRRVGRRVVVLGECASTNDAVFQAAADGPVDGLAVLADHQSAGRGRQGRPWLSPRGASVLCSVGLEVAAVSESSQEQGAPQGGASPEQVMGGRLTLAGAVAACEAVRAATEVVPAIKWPNDLRVGGRKLAGILIESKRLGQRGVRVWVIGIGINCLQQARHFPPELREVSTSLEMASHGPVDRAGVARALLERLDCWLGRSEPVAEELHAAWQHFAEPLGEYVRLRSAGREYSGRTVSVDPAGGLIVQVDEGGQAWFDPMQTKLL